MLKANSPGPPREIRLDSLETVSLRLNLLSFAIYLSTDFVDFYLSNSGTLILLEDACCLFCQVRMC